MNYSLLAQTEKDSAVSKNSKDVLKSLPAPEVSSKRLNYLKLIRIQNLKDLEDEGDLKVKQKPKLEKNESLLDYYNEYSILVDSLFQLEKENFSQNALKPSTLEIIREYSNLTQLTIIIRYVLNKLDINSTSHEQFIRKKLVHAVAEQMKLIAENNQAWYNYNTVEKQWVKGIQIESSNDLFAIGGIQKNNDVDYTGSLKVSISTDLFKMNGLFPTQSYQNIIYGAEVFTPYFKDFTTDSSFNRNDRPHANFKYLGYEFNGISFNYMRRWSFSTKLGIIGSRFGYNFQYFLHRDISLSPYPYGWDAQIAKEGRLGLQVNGKYERLLLKKQADLKSDVVRLVPSASIELAAGHYMTYLEGGINLSSHNFRHRNQDNILRIGKYFTGYDKIWRAKGYMNLNINPRLVIHNTMLEGFGVFSTNEDDANSFAKPSVHKLNGDQVRDFVLFTNFTAGAQFSKFNVFYKYSIKSPEVNIENAMKIDGVSINDRWHHYATIGLSFIL
ncbi:lipid A-modifier LpxR family protein [uncultured Marivirga sp.]|uniref:lipid A-modifier LpxR family protein n=1 Tax=uncultured Marivirga sp. TaxID=1123707 RepID=UPI0030EECBA9